MVTIGKHDVEDIIQRVNRKLPQVSKTVKREFKADYVPQYGGWLVYYYNENGRATAPIGYVTRAMRETGFTQEEIQAYQKDAQSGDYGHLLCVSMYMIDKCNERC